MNKVFYIVTESQDSYYVKAPNRMEAVEILRSAVNKFYFKRKLADDKSMPTPEMLGDNVIVGYSVRENGLNDELSVIDITAQAYIFCQTKEDLWRDWDITEEDVLCQE